MWIVNSIAGTIIDLALLPFRSMSPMVGLTLISAVTGVLFLYAFKWTSDQEGLDRVKRKIHAGIFEIRLFNDDMYAILAAQRDILRYNLSYLRLALIPVLWLLVPFVILVAQLQLHYGYQGLQVGEPAIVKVTFDAEPADPSLDEEAAARAAARRPAPDVVLEVPDGLRLDSPRVWAAPLNQAAWRIVPERPGDYQLAVRVAGSEYGKSVTVSPRVVKRSPIRSDGFWDQVLFPGEPGFPADAPIRAIEVAYPEATVNFLGWQTHWLIAYIIITIVLAFALRRPLGVTF